jgi:recombination protein RecA
MTMIAGPSNAGKSFLVGNAIKATLERGWGVLAIDSENALDAVYLQNMGIDTDNPLYSYKGISELGNVKKVISQFFKAYKAAPKEEQIPFLITIDSLDELRSSVQADKDSRGEIHKDFGLKVQQTAEIQSMILHNIANLPLTCIATKQPYVNQDTYTNKQDPWVITEKLKFAYTQVIFVTNSMMKDKSSNSYEGIKLKVFGKKTRLTKPFQKCVVEVPYETGMDWYTGVLEAAESIGVIEKSGSWYKFNGNNFQRGSFEDYREEVFEALLEREGEAIKYNDEEEIDA